MAFSADNGGPSGSDPIGCPSSLHAGWRKGRPTRKHGFPDWHRSPSIFRGKQGVGGPQGSKETQDLAAKSFQVCSVRKKGPS